MIALSTLSRAGVAAAASLLLTGTLLAVPSNTSERSDMKTEAPARLAAAPALPIVAEAPAADRGVSGPRSSAQTPTLQHRPGTAGMVVGIDPETGELGMPTPEQLRALSDSPLPEVDHSAAGLLEVRHPDGSVSVNLQGRFQEYATVRIGPNGKLIFRCVDGEENAKHAVEGSSPASAAPTPEER